MTAGAPTGWGEPTEPWWQPTTRAAQRRRREDRALPGTHSCHLLAGGATVGDPDRAARLRVGLTADEVALFRVDGRQVWLAGYNAVEGMSAEGSGHLTHDAGFIGGGFGLTGAASGLAAAAVLNLLTQRRTVASTLRIRTATDELMLALTDTTPDVLDRELVPFRVWRRRHAPDPRRAEPPGLGQQLQELSELHQRGVLDEAEFAAAKARLLRSDG